MSDWKPGKGQKIDKLYAWIATEPDGGEGVCAAHFGPAIGWAPLVGADRERIESYRQFAEEARKISGYPVRMVEFSTRVDGEDLL